MRLSDFDYELPPGRIALVPAEPRDAARLFLHDRESGRSEHRRVRDLPELLAPGDLLVVNDTRVVPARLCGQRASGAAVEVLVLGPADPGRAGQGAAGPFSRPASRWRALVKPAGRLRAGESFELEGGALEATALERVLDREGRPGAEWVLAFRDPEEPGRPLVELLEASGRMPLPPYVRRPRGADPQRELDRERYQTVFASARGAVAAPTAGLHFTPELLARLAARGVERASVTLHVGVGTFLPVTVDEVSLHRMHAERYELLPGTAAAVARVRARGGRVVAVGTTAVRVLETLADDSGVVHPGAGETSLFLKPGDRFRAVDAVMTNFHLPRSTLLMLVCAFAGRERVLALYREAVEQGYRFYSFGDAMLIQGRRSGGA